MKKKYFCNSDINGFKLLIIRFMKPKILTWIILTVVLFSCRKNVVEINGIIEFPQKGEYIYLNEIRSDKLIPVDSAIISDDGSFVIKHEVKYPSLYQLKIKQNNFLAMLLEPGEMIKISAHHDSLSYPQFISGSKGSALIAEYNKNMKKTIMKLMTLDDAYNRNIGNPRLLRIIDSLDLLSRDYMFELKSYTKKYIDDNIGSLVSLLALYQQVAPNVYVMDPVVDMAYFKKVDSSLFKLYPEYEPVQTLHQRVMLLISHVEEQGFGTTTPSVGFQAPEISLPSPEGDTIKLSSTRGSVVLLDFWASWCTPCRNENPNLVAVYKKYHPKGFQIYQVSLDKSKEAWIKGIADDHLGDWIHVSDLKYWNSVVVPVFKIESIPYNLLLDKDGQVIAVNLRGDELSARLAQIFD